MSSFVAMLPYFYTQFTYFYSKGPIRTLVILNDLNDSINSMLMMFGARESNKYHDDSFKEIYESRTVIRSCFNVQEVRVKRYLVLWLGEGMNEVASVAVGAVSILKESTASFRLIFRISLMVLFELMKAVGEFATFFIWTIPILNEFFA